VSLFLVSRFYCFFVDNYVFCFLVCLVSIASLSLMCSSVGLLVGCFAFCRLLCLKGCFLFHCVVRHFVFCVVCFFTLVCFVYHVSLFCCVPSFVGVFSVIFVGLFFLFVVCFVVAGSVGYFLWGFIFGFSCWS